MPKTRAPYPADFRAEMVRLVRAGRTPGELSREFEPSDQTHPQLGEPSRVGVGSVGSCALFFLSLITRAFQAVLIDGDKVKVENVTWSAMFSWKDAVDEKPKVEVAAR